MRSKIFMLFAILLLTSCGKQADVTNGGDDSRFFIGKKTYKISEKNRAKFPDWVEIGVECYGLILMKINEVDKIGIPVNVKITKEKKDGYQCTTIEDVKFYKQIGCDKLTIKKGESWWEKEGDLFKTKEEAIACLKKNNQYFDF